MTAMSTMVASKENKEPSTINGIADRKDLNQVIVSIYQKTYIKSCAKCFEWGTECNWIQYLRCTQSYHSIFIAEFDSLFFGLSFYVG